MSEERIGNIGIEQYNKALYYFQKYWKYFVQKNPSVAEDSEEEQKWLDIYFMVFLSGFSAGINVGEEQTKEFYKEIAESN